MKYIRTDIGIFESEKRNQNPKMFECLWGSVLKEADTIEELCDEFVLVLKDKHKSIKDNIYDKEEYYEIYSSYDFAKNYYEEEYYDFYGAIWTDKGLIYVAKMNDKGELVLI